MPSNRSHPSHSRAGVICSRPNSPVRTRPTYSLLSLAQDLLLPNNALACQLSDPSGQQSSPSCQYRAFQVDTEFSHGDVEPSQDNTGPSQADRVPSWTKARTSWAEIWHSQDQLSACWAHRGTSQAKKGPIRSTQGLLKPNRAL